jgi:sporulation protein YlmC with PRC-barrel domain
MTSQNHATLSKLTGTGMTVDNATDDMRGRKVTDKDGKDVGKVQDVFVDDRERKARFLLVEHGGFLGIGEKKSTLATTSPRRPAMTRNWSTTAATRAASTATTAARPTGQPATPIRASICNARSDGPADCVDDG